MLVQNILLITIYFIRRGDHFFVNMLNITTLIKDASPTIGGILKGIANFLLGITRVMPNFLFTLEVISIAIPTNADECLRHSSAFVGLRPGIAKKCVMN